MRHDAPVPSSREQSHIRRGYIRVPADDWGELVRLAAAGDRTVAAECRRAIRLYVTAAARAAAVIEAHPSGPPATGNGSAGFAGPRD